MTTLHVADYYFRSARSYPTLDFIPGNPHLEADYHMVSIAQHIKDPGQDLVVTGCVYYNILY